MASLEILLSKVRSETPTSFFFVLSNTAFFAKPEVGAPPAPASFLRPARFDTAFGAYIEEYMLVSAASSPRR
jgi:hypothetical protein